MSQKDNPDPLNRPAGAVSLTKYMAHGGGMELFRAYVERRNADQQMNLDRKAEIIAIMTPEAGGGVPIDVFERASAELTMIQILEELDPVIEGLLRVCEGTSEGAARLVELHIALRIEDGIAPSDSAKIEQKWAIQQRWIDAYLTMQATGVSRSRNAIARQIAKDFGVSQSKAIGDWNGKKRDEPWLGQWASEIESRSKIRNAMVRKFGSNPDAISKRLLETSEKRKVRRRRKITFGKACNPN